MTKQELGFRQELFLLPFDHRASFEEKLFGIKDRKSTVAENRQIADYKYLIYQGFQLAVQNGVNHSKAGILTDEEFGSKILLQAKKENFITACPVEKSGQDDFDFEYGPDFGAHIAKFNPTFSKVLVRYNPDGDPKLNQDQIAKLKQLSDYLSERNRKFMFELLVPATESQLQQFQGDKKRYDEELRPLLMVRAIQAIQNAGIECDIWKVEGLSTREDCEKIVAAAQNTPHRKAVGLIILGRGESDEKVKNWIETAAGVRGFIGFAVGRTVFWNPLKSVKEGKCTQDQAVQQIARNYEQFCRIWFEARSAAKFDNSQGLT